MGSIQKSGNQSENNQAGRDLTKIDIGTMFGISLEKLQVIQFVLNIQGQGTGTLGEALSRLQPLDLPLPALPKTPDIQSLIGEVQKSIQEHAVEVNTDLALLAEVLKSSIESEGKKEHPLPGQFISRLVNAIGAKLDDAGIFKSDFALTHKDPLSSRNNFSEVPMIGTTVALIKSKEYRNVIWLKQTTEEEFQERTLPAKGIFRREVVEHNYFSVLKYRLECNKKPIVTDGGYHIKIEMEEKPNTPPVPLSTTILTKVTRALLHDLLEYMRYPEGTKIFLESLAR